MASMIRVLAVEDDPSARLLLTDGLSKQKKLELCAVAEDGLEGLELMRELKPDVVLLDLIMPGMDGLSFLRNLSRKERPVVVVVSQVSGQGVIRQALRLGASYYLIKPLNFQSLPDLLSGLCLVPLTKKAEELLKELNVKGRGVQAAARAAAVLARDETALLKHAYAPTIAAERSNYAAVEKNIRDMVNKLHRAASPGYQAIMGGLPSSRPNNQEFLLALAKILREDL